MIALNPMMPESARLARREFSAGHFIPYACHWDDQTVLTKNGELAQVIRIDGFSAETVEPDEIDLKKTLRNALFKSIAGRDYAIWFHIVRHRRSSYPKGDFNPGFAHNVNERWRQKNEAHARYENKLYISLVRRGEGVMMGGFQNIFRSLSHKIDKERRSVFLHKACRELTETTRRIEAALADYGPRVLTTRRTPAGQASEPLEFFSQLINLEERTVLKPVRDVSRYLSAKRLFFGHRAMECRGSTRSRLAAMVSIKEYGQETAPGMMDGFFCLPVEFVMTQSFVFSHRQEAISAMKKQQRLMVQTEDVASSQISEIDQALDEAMSGTIGFGEHHLTVQPIASSLPELDDAVALIEAELINVGLVAVREDLNLEPAFWAQLPGNFEYIARRSVISTANFAGFMSLHNFPIGKSDHNHWGPAVTVFETTSGTPYFFNFHRADVGHTMVIGPTGTGKTMLINFLTAQAQKFKGRLFFFDKDRGAEIFLRALGGTYAVLGGGQDSGFNPLQLADTPDNRAFLNEWLRSLVSPDGELTSQELTTIAEAVKNTFKLAAADRTLELISPFFGTASPGSLGSRLALWHSSGPHRHVFGGTEDKLALSKAVIGFDMGQVLREPQILGPVLLYLFHRIQLVLDGTPTLLVLDEAWALLDNPIFAAKIKDWLKTLRKLNAVVVFATQSVEDASTSLISDTLVQQSATHIFFPNAKATEAYRQVFKLSERELDLIRELDPSSRCFLIKHDRDSVIAKLDLGGMKDITSVLSGRAETVARLDRIREETGDDPQNWLSKYMEGCNDEVVASK